MNHKYRLVLISLMFLVANTSLVSAASCVDKTCVDVLTEDNQLVITAHRAGGVTSSKSTPKVAPKVAPKAAPKAVTTKPVASPPKLLPLPKKTATASQVKKPVSKPVKKTVKKVVASKSTTTASLSDRLTKLLPVGDINYQPDIDPIVNVPIYFWSNTPSRFTAVVPILNLLVYVDLTPTFTWRFGDGGFEISKLPGAAYPIGGISHSYKAAGDYGVNLTISWSGTWSVNGVITPINGNSLTQSISTTLNVVSAPTKFIK